MTDTLYHGYIVQWIYCIMDTMRPSGFGKKGSPTNVPIFWRYSLEGGLYFQQNKDYQKCFLE